MDAPLAVRGDVVHQLALRFGLRDLGLIQHGVIGARLVDRQVFAPLQVSLVVEVEVLAAGQRAPGNQLLDIEREGRVGASLVDAGRPGRGGQHAARLGDQIGEVVAHGARPFCQMGQVAAGLVFLLFKSAVGQFAVGDGVEAQDGIYHFARFFQAGIGFAVELASLFHDQRLVFVCHGNLQPVCRHAILFHAWPQADHLFVELGVIALDHAELGHGLAGDGFAFALFPIAG